MLAFIRAIRFGFSLIATLLMIESVVCGQDPAAWDSAKAANEDEGLRLYSMNLSNEIADAMREASEESFPRIHAFVEMYDKAYAAIDEEKPVSSWPAVNVQKLVVHNGDYWRAFYEVRPGDPLLMMFHSARYGCNGQASRTFYSEQIAIHTPVETNVREKLFWLMILGRRVMSLGDGGVVAGDELADKEQWQQAVDTYDSVLSAIPKHAFALFALAQLADKTPAKMVKLDKKQLLRDSRRQDPFRVEAYQGDFSVSEFKEMMTLRRSALPAWRAFQNAGTETPYSFGKLEELSFSLQAAGLHELALLVRQLVVARRPGSYSDADSEFIKKSLAVLCPDDDFSETVNRFRDQVAPFSLAWEKPTK